MDRLQGGLIKNQWKFLLFHAAKISVGCILSILIAYELGLKNSSTAGVITVLSIQGTKLSTIRTAARRCAAFAGALVIARISYEIFGYNTVGFGCFLFFFVFLCIALGWDNVISICAVLVLHFLEVDNMEGPMLYNEIFIFIIGISMGIFMNLHLRKNVREMIFHVESMDEKIRIVLENMAEQLLQHQCEDNMEYFLQMDEQITRAESVVWLSHQNTLYVRKKAVISPARELEYIQMRKKQCEVLYEMNKRISQLKMKPPQAKEISAFLKKVAMEYDRNDDMRMLLAELKHVFSKMKLTPLPKERKEFESRAVLYVFLLNIQEFLEIKKNKSETSVEKSC